MRQNDLGWKLLGAGAAAWLGWKLIQRTREADLSGSVVAITGGSRGLGLLLAREFGRHGCRVAICARNVEELEDACTELETEGVETLPVIADISDREQAEEFIRRTAGYFGRIDMLVNNAGIIQVGPLQAMHVEDFERAMAINFWGAVYCTFAALPFMREFGHGRIVNITSIGGKVAVPHLLPYDCAKFALVAFSQGGAAELAREGIKVTTIVPGLMRTGSFVHADFKGDQDSEYGWFKLGSTTPLTAMAATRAAKRIVTAARRGETEVTLTWQALALRAMEGLNPGANVRVLSAVNRLLPH